MQIALHNISKAFGELPALSAVSFEVADRECFFLLGPSGCGKTTLLRIIAGFCRPDAGEILFDGRPVNNLPAHRRNAGLVFQNYALWPHLTVTENIAFGLTVPAHRAAKPERLKRVQQMLELLHLEGTEKRLPSQLSGGQQQRVALARALVVKPACLLLDEPLSNLDAKLRAEMRSELKQLIRAIGITAVYVTHDQLETIAMADRCALMRNGRIEQIGAPRELYARPASRFAADFLGCANLLAGKVIAQNEDTLRLANAAGTWASQTPGRQFPPGTAVTIALRAENVRLDAASPDQPNYFPARVREKIYLGAAIEYRLELKGGICLQALQSAGAAGPAEVNAPIPIWFEPRDVLVLPAE